MSTQHTITGTISSIAAGGMGVMRHDGFVYFIPFTAVGEEVVCEVTDRRKGFAFAKLIRVITPSPQRIKPPCPYFGTCGGCQLQHLTYETQVSAKTKIVQDSLERIGKLPNLTVLPTVPAVLNHYYRRHITLHYQGFQLGYMKEDSNTLLPIQSCWIFSPHMGVLLEQIKELMKSLFTEPKTGKIVVLKDEDRFIVHIETLDKFLPSIKGSFPLIKAASINLHSLFGSTEITFDVLGLKFFGSPKVFLQNHPEQSQKIYASLPIPTSGLVIDAYSGIGISTLLLAQKGAKVIGIESNPFSHQLALKNQKANKSDNVTFILGDVKKKLKGLKPNLVVINPPRIGIDPEVTKQLLHMKPEKIVYISCMPSTLARDLKTLSEGCYTIEHCQPYDMFPQTAHVETVVTLSLGPNLSRKLNC